MTCYSNNRFTLPKRKYYYRRPLACDFRPVYSFEFKSYDQRKVTHFRQSEGRFPCITITIIKDHLKNNLYIIKHHAMRTIYKRWSENDIKQMLEITKYAIQARIQGETMASMAPTPTKSRKLIIIHIKHHNYFSVKQFVWTLI